MPLVITAFYSLIILIFLFFGAAIIFHLLYYKINRRVSGIMSLIYIVGAFLLIISNFILFQQVNWERLFGNLKI